MIRTRVPFSRLVSPPVILRSYKIRYNSTTPTVPKLTIFTGPNCSLCDDAKALLKAIRKEHPFELDTVDIQAKGQEKWKKRYVYHIPVLHLEDKRVAWERWNPDDVKRAIESWKPEDATSRQLSLKGKDHGK